MFIGIISFFSNQNTTSVQKCKQDISSFSIYLVENKIKFFFDLTDYYFFLRFCIYCKKHALNITIKVTALILQVLLVQSLPSYMKVHSVKNDNFLTLVCYQFMISLYITMYTKKFLNFEFMRKKKNLNQYTYKHNFERIYFRILSKSVKLTGMSLPHMKNQKTVSYFLFSSFFPPIKKLLCSVSLKNVLLWIWSKTRQMMST